MSSRKASGPSSRLLGRTLDAARGGFELVLLGAQLLAVLWLLDRFEVGGVPYSRLAWVILVGFPVHALLPRPLRLRFFVALSMVAAVVVLGPRGSAWLAAIATVLVVASRLPVRTTLRISVVVALAGALAAARSGALVPSLGTAPSLLWPIVGSMFMFRLPIYLYDVSQDTRRPRLADTLAYFLMLPNPAFPLFPVVDFKTFQRTYYDRHEIEIYRTGVILMLRGLVHLLLYRAVYYHLVLAPEQVVDLLDLAQYLAANFLLYLQVSGLFHLITGILHLFGFDLPPTHRLYFLAPSVSEFWRRANTYWRDFQLKLVYFPALLRLKGFGLTGAVAGATVLVFTVTWVLHSYQLFWLRGDGTPIWQDAAFWGGLGLLVLIPAVRQARGRRTRRRAQSHLERAVRAGVGTAFTFVLLATLWSIWTCSSWAEWVTLWRVQAPAGQILALIAGLAILGLAGGLAARTSPRTAVDASRSELFLERRLWAPTALLAGLVTITVLPGLASTGVLRSFEPLSVATLHPRDIERLEDGYYEKISGFARLDWAELSGDHPGFVAFAGQRPVDDLRVKAFLPNLETEFKGRRLTTNRWGLRDREYSLEKPAGTIRFALLGPSPVAGSGVADEEIFEALAEERLERQAGGTASPRIEILNFAVPGDGPLASLERLRHDVLRFSPDAVIYVATIREFRGASNKLKHLVDREIPISYPFLARRVERAGVGPGLARAEFYRLMKPYSTEIVGWTYQKITRLCRVRGLTAIWLYLDRPRVDVNENRSSTETLAREAGFRIWDFSGLYAGYTASALIVGKRDGHPNARAHRLIADRFYDLILTELETLSGLPTGGLSAPTDGGP